MSAEATAVLDASAILALINEEPGAAEVEAVLGQAAVSAINLSESAGKLVDRGMPLIQARAALESLQLALHSFDEEAAYASAELRGTLPRSLSLGDRGCLALARYLKLEVLTADTEWETLSIPGVRVRVIR